MGWAESRLTMRPAGPIAAKVVADLRFRRRMEALHAMGPRVMAELVAEIVAAPLDQFTIEERLDRFLAISNDALDASGGDRFPPAPLHEVPGCGRSVP